VEAWVHYLREEKLWGNDDPLFPATRIEVGSTHLFEAAGFKKAHWSTATPVRTIFRDAFECAGLPYFNPHSIRKTLARLGGQVCASAEEYKAWSQNLGHKQVLTTLTSYGTVATERQGDIIKGMGSARLSTPPGADEIETLEAVVRRLRAANIAAAQ
jgi:integrase/recombinase XerD